MGDFVDVGRKYDSLMLDYHAKIDVDDALPLGNISFCRINDAYCLCSIRQFNYALSKKTDKGKLFGDFNSGRANYVIVIDRDFNFVKRIDCDDLEMIEDIRLMRYGDVIQVSGTDVTYGDKMYRIVCIDFKLNKTSNRLDMIHKTVFPIPHEKNYIPVEDGKGVFVSDLLRGELRMTSILDPARKISQKCRGLIPYSGSSPLLRYRDGYVALVHRRQKRRYVNAFAFFDRRLVQCRLSDEFTVFGDVSKVNFTCGMLIDGDIAILPICVHDDTTHLFRLPLQDFSMTARWRS